MTSSIISFTNFPKFSGVIGEFFISKSFSFKRENNSEVIQFTTNFDDFYEVPDLNFDISRLQSDLNKILESKNFNSPGVTHFGAIPLNQIPNDENSIKGNNIRGKYWTIADDLSLIHI